MSAPVTTRWWRPGWSALVTALGLGVLPVCAAETTYATAEVSGRRPAIAAWWTSTQGNERLQAREGLRLAPRGDSVVTIEVQPTARRQDIVGFGAAMTDASAWLLRERLDVADRDRLMADWFDPQRGLGLSFLRLTIGASDFSLTHYSLDDVPPGESDESLARFSLDAGGALPVPLVQQALALNPSLKVMASPWSAPGWMKTTDSLVKGTLREDRRAAFAEYLSRYVQAMHDRGIPLFALTLQNEPHFEPKDYPGMRLHDDDRRALLAHFVGPLFARRHPEVRLLEWDHNWNRPEEPLAVLADPQAAAFVAGVAWHCYEGHVEAQSRVHEAHPEQEAYLTECSGGGWEKRHADPFVDFVRVLFIGATRHWARGVLLWNLALDETSGPHLGGCHDCRGVVTIDSRTGAVTRNPEYYALAHFSRWVRPGAHRVDSSDGDDGLDNVAFRNVDDSLVLVVANSSARSREFTVGAGTCAFADSLPSRSVATYVWPADADCS